jgi:hypothetical protein
MTDRQYRELFEAILDLRSATELGFRTVDRRFDEMEERWNRRFGALESRVEDGFKDVERRFNETTDRFGTLEQRVESGFRDVSGALTDVRTRLAAVAQMAP